MIQLQKKIEDDLKAAMKQQEALKVSTLRLLLAAIKNLEIQKGPTVLEEDDIIAVIKKQVKQREEAIAQFTKGNRPDLAQKEQSELKILLQYLPAPMSDDALTTLIKEIALRENITNPNDFGKLMKSVMAKAGTATDGKKVSLLVKSFLQKT